MGRKGGIMREVPQASNLAIGIVAYCSRRKILIRAVGSAPTHNPERGNCDIIHKSLCDSREDRRRCQGVSSNGRTADFKPVNGSSTLSTLAQATSPAFIKWTKNNNYYGWYHSSSAVRDAASN